MSEEKALVISNITKKYKKHKVDENGKIRPYCYYALKNVSLTVNKGEIIGVIGKNGSGKSTLLSIISKIMEPDNGVVTVNGKLASILELNIGFNPDLSGKENIFQKCRLYGFSNKYIRSIFQQIVDYSGLNDQIEDPIRTYSSGMIGRLAFSIIVHVNADILVIDEVLSTGDEEFSLKAKTHFQQLAKNGKTIVIVSHSLDYIERSCTHAVWMERGEIVKEGKSADVCKEYRNNIQTSPLVILDLAQKGFPEYQYKLGCMYRDGNYYEQNEKLYWHWIKKAADNQYVPALLLLSDNPSIEYDQKMHTLEIAAKKGNMQAKIKYASEYSKTDNPHLIDTLKNIYAQLDTTTSPQLQFYHGDLILKTAKDEYDRKCSFELLKNAAKLGNINAMYYVGIMYFEGIGTKKNIDESISYYSLAANNGHLLSALKLSQLYSEGNQLKKDDEEFFRWTLIAAQLGHNPSQFLVAECYRKGVGTNLDNKHAIYWYRRFLEDPIYKYSIVAFDCIKASDYCNNVLPQTLLYMPAKAGDVKAIKKIFENEYAEYYLEMIDVLNVLVNRNNTEAIRQLASCYIQGKGVSTNYNKAIELLEQGANLEDLPSIKALIALYLKIDQQKYQNKIQYWLEKQQQISSLDLS